MNVPPPSRQPAARELVLASSSPWRRRQLEQLQLPFRVVVPDVDETPAAGERAAALVRRLALAKARKVAAACPAALVIGADQAATVAGRIIGKPGSRERATAQAGARLRGATSRSIRGWRWWMRRAAASKAAWSRAGRGFAPWTRR